MLIKTNAEKQNDLKKVNVTFFILICGLIKKHKLQS